MTFASGRIRERGIARRLAEAEATIAALLAGQIDAVVDTRTNTPVLLLKAHEALRESEERYRRIVETTREGVWLTDAENRTTFMNRRMADMLGCEADMGRGCTPFDFLDEEQCARLTTHLGENNAERIEVRFRRKDGTSVWARLHSVPVLDRAGLNDGHLAMVMDITERRDAYEAQRRKAAEQLERDHVSAAEIRRERDRAQRYLDTAYAMLVALDTDGRIALVNRYACSVLGWSAEELVGRSWIETCISPAARPDMRQRFQQMLDGALTLFENPVLTKSGEERLIEWRNTLQHDDSGQVTGSLSSGTDITARHQAIEAHRTAEERMRFALESTHIGIWDQDYGTGELKWSEILEAQYGLEPGSFDRTFESFIKLVHPDDQASLLETVGKSMQTGGDFKVQHRVVWADGTVRWLNGAGRVVLDSRGQALRAVGISQDITEQRARQSQYEHSQKMEAIGRLAGGVAHDFNNIVSVILTCSEFLLDDLQPMDPARINAEEICKAGRRAADLTRQLLMFSRQQVLAPKVLDLGAVTANMESMLRRVVGEDVDLNVKIDDHLGCVRADPGSIEQVIMNLAVNARDAMPTGGRLTIDIRNAVIDEHFIRHHLQNAEPGRYVVLSMSDTGIGIDQATEARIFEPFFTTKEVGKGTGLGLSTAFGIVQQSNGTIRVESALGQGTTFRVYLPHVDDPADALHHDLPKPGLRGSETILLVEDEDQVRAVARSILQRKGYRVIEMRGPAEAMMYCGHDPEHIDLLLTDVVMPVMSGPELGRKLAEILPGLKVLCMSGYTADNVVRHGVHEGVTALLDKPFTPESLTSKVREVLAMVTRQA